MTRDQFIEHVKKWPRRSGKAEYLRYLNGATLSRNEAIRAKCYACHTGEDREPCTISECPLQRFQHLTYSQQG